MKPWRWRWRAIRRGLPSLRRKLAADRATAPLFDTPRLARDLEALIAKC